MRADIEEHVKLVTDRHAFHELTNILVDNAVKYCDDGGTVLVSLKESAEDIVSLRLL